MSTLSGNRAGSNAYGSDGGLSAESAGYQYNKLGMLTGFGCALIRHAGHEAAFLPEQPGGDPAQQPASSPRRNRTPAGKPRPAVRTHTATGHPMAAVRPAQRRDSVSALRSPPAIT